MARTPVKKPIGELALQTIDFSADIGAGLEGADKDSFAIPFLRVLQKGSPQCDEASGEFIAGAKPGMLMNSVTKKLYDGQEGVIFLQAAFQRRFLRWGQRSSNEGFKGEYTVEDVEAMMRDGTVKELDRRLYVTGPNEAPHEKKHDRMVDTRSHFGILVDPDGATQVLFPLASTQIKKSKQLISMLKAQTVKDKGGNVAVPPTWMVKVRVTTVPEQNDEGSWHGVKFAIEGLLGPDEAWLYDMGKSFHAAIVSGKAKATYEEPAAETEDKF